MKHRAMTSAVFELIQTFEFDMTLGDDSWPTRVELYQATTQPNLFRCRVWQAEFYRMQSTFPQNGGFPAHAPSDELVLVDRSGHLRCTWDTTGFGILAYRNFPTTVHAGQRSEPMGVLTGDMKRVVDEQRLGFVATVCSDGTPNLSPKGTTAVWDDEHLVFANVRSPMTVANLRRNPNVEINVVDPFVRKGYRFKGVATVLDSGPLHDAVIAFYKNRGVANAIREVVMVRVRSAQPLDSPAYDLGLTEDEVRARWEHYWQTVRAGKAASPTGE